jgi:cell division protein FtsB
VLHRILGRLTTRRAALLALVVCALALSVAVPLHTYLSQRADLRSQLQQQQVLRSQEAQLNQAQQRLSDTAQVEAEARTRFGYVMPGEVPYVVQLPGGLPPVGQQPAGPQAAPDTSWYQQLWSSVVGNH